MNKLFKAPKKLLSYTLLITATVLALGVILVAFLGFNKSYQFGGYYEINIDYIDMEKKQEYLDGIDEILNKYGYSVDDYTMDGEKTYTPTLCIKYKSASETDAESIRADIIAKFNIDEKASLLSVDKISATYESHKIVFLLIPLAIALVALFLYGWIRKDVLYGVACIISFVSTMLVGLALYAVTRTLISTSSLALLFASALMSMALFVFYSSTTFARKNSIHAEKKEIGEVFSEAITSQKFTLGIPALLLFAIFLGFVFTFNHTLMHIGFAGMVCVLSAVWSAIFVTGSYFVTIASNIKSKPKKENAKKAVPSNEN